jgi:hypothetical protein
MALKDKVKEDQYSIRTAIWAKKEGQGVLGNGECS